MLASPQNFMLQQDHILKLILMTHLLDTVLKMSEELTNQSPLEVKIVIYVN